MSADMTPAREALAAAIEAHGVAAAKTRKAAEAVSRAAIELTDAETALRSYDAVEAEINEHRAAALRRWAEEGGERPNLAAPADLAARMLGKADAMAFAESVRAVVRSLEAAHAARKTEADTAMAAVQKAMRKVVMDDSDQIAAELREVEQRAFELRTILHAMQGMQTGTYDPPLSRDALNALMTQPDDPRRHGINSLVDRRRTSLTQAWRSYMARLHTDATAQFQAPAA